MVDVELDVAARAVGATRDAFDAARATAFALGLTIMMTAICQGRAELEDDCCGRSQSILGDEENRSKSMMRIVVCLIGYEIKSEVHEELRFSAPDDRDSSFH